jgi:hypothetical protein
VNLTFDPNNAYQWLGIAVAVLTLLDRLGFHMGPWTSAIAYLAKMLGGAPPVLAVTTPVTTPVVTPVNTAPGPLGDIFARLAKLESAMAIVAKPAAVILLALFLFLSCGHAHAAPPAKPVAASIAGTLRTRIAADRFLRRLDREGDLTPDQAAAVALIRGNDDAMHDFVAGLPAVKEVSATFGDAGANPILDWLSKVAKALWDNRQAILDFIMQLVKLIHPVP